MRVNDLEDSLAEFKSAFNALPEVVEPPRTTLQLLSEPSREKYWNRYLNYFLDPENPHGLQGDFLRAFLQELDERFDGTNLSEGPISDIEIQSEVDSDGGRPDLLLYLPDEWFVCIELKVTAPETGTQTKSYAEAGRFGDLAVMKYSESGRYYLYLADSSRQGPSSESFERMGWKTIRDLIEDLLRGGKGRYPARTTAQLTDFSDTIRKQIMNDDPYDEQEAEYLELYLKHAEAIDTVQGAFEKMIDREIDRWAGVLRDEYRPSEWTDHWTCESGKYGKIYKSAWRLDEGGEPTSSWSDAAYRLEFRHEIRKERSWKEGTVTLHTHVPHNSNDEYRDLFQKHATARLDDLQDVASDTRISVTGNKVNLTEATYSYDPTEGPAGYYRTLSDAFDEHTVLVPLLSGLLETTVDQLLEG